MINKIKQALTFDDITLVPQYSRIETRSLCNTKTKIGEIELDIPLISSPMQTVTEYNMALTMINNGGMPVIHRFMSIQEQADLFKKISEDLASNFKKHHINRICCAVGVTNDYKDRISALYKAGCVTFNLDVAHGDHVLSYSAIETIREMYGNRIHIMSGTICTAKAAERLCNAGVDSIRVGVGSGSLCETRIRTGVGIPQVTAIMDCYEVVKKCQRKISIIADGGIRMPGDVCKAIAIGADAVMVGYLFAGTDEAPGQIIRAGNWPNEQLFKQYAGSASFDAKRSRGEETKNIEGNSTLIPYKGSVNRIIKDIEDGLKSSMSYLGSYDITEYQDNCEIMQITNNGLIEAQPHAMIRK